MDLVYQKYVKETFDASGVLQSIAFDIPETFNYAFDVVDEVAKKTPDKNAMVWVSKDKERRDFTFSYMAKRSAQAANYFKSLGIKKGDIVMLVLKRHYQFWPAILGCHKLGAVALPATNLLTKHDFVYRFNAAKVKAIVCTADGDTATAAKEAAAECPTVTIFSMVNETRDGWDNFDEGLDRQSETFTRQDSDTMRDDDMLMFFTSGTTSYPKIAVHSHPYSIGHLMTARYWHNVDPEGIHFTVADTGWGKAVWGKLYGQWLCEACVFTYDFDKFSGTEVLEMFSTHKITTFCAPPTIYRFMIKEDLSKYDLSSLKYVTTAGEALNPEVYNRFHEYTGLWIMEGFGQTETTLTILNLVGTTARPGSMGKPSPQYDVQLLTAEGTETKTGETGEICVRTAEGNPCGIFKGYYLDEAKTNEVWHDGYYHTGDMAWRDEDGYLWFVGRTDDLIKSSGYRISPFEVESVLMEHPSVLECAVTGVPDEVRGQAIKATIVLVAGTEGTDAFKKELQEFMKAKTAPYKYPRVIEFVRELPKTISGKIRRVEIRAQDNAN